MSSSKRAPSEHRLERTVEFIPADSNSASGRPADADQIPEGGSSNPHLLGNASVVDTASDSVASNRPRWLGGAADRAGAASKDGQPRVGLIETSKSMTEESLILLRDRLRIVATLLFAGYLAFFLFGVLVAAETLRLKGVLLLSAHLVTMLVTGLVAARLWMRCPLVNRYARFAELLVFGLAAVFFWAEQLCSGAAYSVPRVCPALG